MDSVQDAIIANHHLYLRHFLWRAFHDPYAIMIAEFMLHRTRAEQVQPIYDDFLTHYPDLNSLANAPEEKIQSVTQHLGLHWRAAHFRKAALFILERFDGKIPRNRKDLLEIPGIGDYVAGAILVVCFGKPEHVIDSNIARFLNRYYGLGAIGEIRRKKVIVEKAKEFWNYGRTRTLLFALLDFAALFCSAKNPNCNNCIFRDSCFFFENP